MDARALKALKASITDKWVPIVEGVAGDNGADDCPLCSEFMQYVTKSIAGIGIMVKKTKCTGCPIHTHTGKHGCVGTPYVAWRALYGRDNHTKLTSNGIVPISEKARDLCRQELAFLRSLLPEGEDV